jgi:capsule polysaccharide export protein KpsE/RkpR
MPTPTDASFMYEELKDSLKTTAGLIQTLTSETKDTQIELATLETRLDSIEEEVQKLVKIVTEGNGTQSILTRLALLESELELTTTALKEFKGVMWERINDATKEVLDLAKGPKSRGKSKVSYNREKILALLQVVPGIASLIYLVLEAVLK